MISIGISFGFLIGLLAGWLLGGKFHIEAHQSYLRFSIWADRMWIRLKLWWEARRGTRTP